MQLETFVTILMFLLVFIYGLCIGSFTNVLIYRIPKNENIATKSSHCMVCNHRLRWYDLFPLFSYLFLGGKCRYCKAKISAQYPIVEAINGLGYLLIFYVVGLNMTSVIFSLAFSCLVVITVIDWRTYYIYDCMIIALLVLGIIRTGLDYQHILDYVIGFFAVSTFLFLIYVISHERAMGLGDVKLMAVAGLLVGYKGIILAMVLGSIIGSVIHLIRMRVSKQENVLALGPYLSAGIFIAMLYTDAIIDWYIKTIWQR